MVTKEKKTSLGDPNGGGGTKKHFTPPLVVREKTQNQGGGNKGGLGGMPLGGNFSFLFVEGKGGGKGGGAPS